MDAIVKPMFGMETWFILIVASAMIGGFGTFGNKIAVARNYNSALILGGSALVTTLFFLPAAFWFEGSQVLSTYFILIMALAGFITSFSSVIKIQALHYIDSAIFLPLFKVVGPIIVVLFGMLFFAESFTLREWVGIIISLLVPLMLISRVEHSRQNNLTLGLGLVVVAACVSAVGAALQKYGTDLSQVPLFVMGIASAAITVGAAAQYCFFQRDQIITTLKMHQVWGVFQVIMLRAVFAGTGMYLMILAFAYGGPLGIVYTINSLYILPPIILAIIFYGEHWNLRKAAAIGLSILALALLN